MGQRLEPIQEESEQEDDTEGSRTGEGGEEEVFQIPGGEESKEVTAEDETEEDEDDAPLLGVKRPRRLPRSLSRESFPRTPSISDHHEEMESFSLSDWSSLAVDLCDEASPPEQTSSGNKRSELRIKVSVFAQTTFILNS